LKIFDVRGRLVKWLLNNRPSAGHGEVIWDGTHNDGAKARIGMYIIYLEAINAQNGVIETSKRTVVLAGKL
jgi:flagellar hook assembly protein FlgD